MEVKYQKTTYHVGDTVEVRIDPDFPEPQPKLKPHMEPRDVTWTKGVIERVVDGWPVINTDIDRKRHCTLWLNQPYEMRKL